MNIQAGYQSSVIVSLKIEKGLAVLNPPARESGSNNVMPGQQGELLLNVENANIFVVSGYKGDDNLAYICVEVHSANLYHCGEYYLNTHIAKAIIYKTYYICS